MQENLFMIIRIFNPSSGSGSTTIANANLAECSLPNFWLEWYTQCFWLRNQFFDTKGQYTNKNQQVLRVCLIIHIIVRIIRISHVLVLGMSWPILIYEHLVLQKRIVPRNPFETDFPWHKLTNYWGVPHWTAKLPTAGLKIRSFGLPQLALCCKVAIIQHPLNDTDYSVSYYSMFLKWLLLYIII